MDDTNFDVIIIGAGPGGYVTAIRAAQLGMRTAIIEKKHLGGICLNWGCIPTKTLLRTAEIYDFIKHAGDYGLSVEKASFDLKKIVERSRGVSKHLNAGVGHLLKKNKVTVIDGTARLNGPGKVDVTAPDGKVAPSLTGKHIIIATGARPRAWAGSSTCSAESTCSARTPRSPGSCAARSSTRVRGRGTSSRNPLHPAIGGTVGGSNNV